MLVGFYKYSTRKFCARCKVPPLFACHMESTGTTLVKIRFTHTDGMKKMCYSTGDARKNHVKI